MARIRPRHDFHADAAPRRRVAVVRSRAGVFRQSRQVLDDADGKLNAFEPRGPVEHMEVRDDLMLELDEQSIRRLVAGFVEPGEKVFVGRALVGGPQKRVD